MFLFCLALLQFGIHPAYAATHDYIAERAYYEDTSNALRLDDVKEKPFKAFSGMLSQSYSKSAFWVRVKVAGTEKADAEQRLVLKIQPTYLDEIRLYDAAEPAKLNRVVGDRYPFANNERKSLTYDFLIPASLQPRYVWLRLKTTSTSLMQISVVSEDDAQFIDRTLEVASTVIFSLLLIFLIGAFVYWTLTRERLVGVFLIRQLMGMAFFAAYMGYLRILFAGQISPSFFDVTLSFLVLTSTAAALWFHAEFFKDYLIKPKLQAVFTVMLLLLPVEVVMFVAGFTSLALKINMFVVLLSPFFMLWLSIFAIPWDKLALSVYVLPRRYVIWAHALYVLVTSMAAMPSLALASGGIFSPHAVLLHAILTSIVMIFILVYRARRIQEKQIVDVIVADQNAWFEKTKREEQGRFLEMLTHEFKTSLAVLKMSLGSVDMASKQGRYADQAVDSMNDVIERCLQVQSLSDNHVQVASDAVDFTGLVEDIVYGARASERIQIDAAQSIKLKSDEKLLKVVVTNLIDNAIKYSVSDSIIHVTIKEGKLTVSNMPGNAGKPDPSLVFTKYYRSARAHEQIGSGLGLYLTSQFASMLGMRLSYVPKDEIVEFELCLIPSI